MYKRTSGLPLYTDGGCTKKINAHPGVLLRMGILIYMFNMFYMSEIFPLLLGCLLLFTIPFLLYLSEI